MTFLHRQWQRIRHPLQREEGQAAFEFLLMLPLFFTFFLMVLDFGVTMYGYVSIANAAREGARYGAVNCGTDVCTANLIQTRTVGRSGGFLADNADVTVSWPSGGSRGSPVAVNVSHDHDLLFFPFTWTIGSCAEMRLEQAEAGITAGGTGC